MNKADWLFHTHDDRRGILRELAEGMTARIFAGEKVMLSVVHIAPNSQGKLHSHPEEQWGVLLEGRCTRVQGTEEIQVEAGTFWHTPGGIAHTIRTGDAAAVVLDIFSPPRAEYSVPGRGFGKGRWGGRQQAAPEMRCSDGSEPKSCCVARFQNRESQSLNRPRLD